MSLVDNKITAFSKTIAALADKPSLGTTALLKQWFDSSPEELRVAHNNLIDFMAANYKFSSTSLNVLDYGASGLATTFTGNITSGTKVLTLTTTPDFAVGQGINLQGALEASSLQVTGAATASSNVTVTLNGVAFPVAIVSGDTAIQVATKIRAATYAGWAAGGTAGTDTVTFTSNTSGVKTDATYSAGTTTATGTMTTTTQGTADQISTVSSVSGLVVNIADNSTRTITAGTILHDDTAAIQAAISAAGIGGELIFPRAMYLITQKLAMLQSQLWRGVGGQRGTTIKKGANIDMIEMVSLCALEDINLDGQGASYTGRGVYISGGFSQEITNVRIDSTAGVALYFAADQGSGAKVSNLEAGTIDQINVAAVGIGGDSTAKPRFFNNIWLSGGFFDLSGCNDQFLSNCYVRSLKTNSASAQIYCVNTRFALVGSAMTLSGTDCKYSNCAFAGVVNLVSAQGIALKACDIGYGYTEDQATCQFNDIDFQSTAYTPVWSQSSGTQPVLGNGTITGRYTRAGKICTVQIILTLGSTTTIGNSGTGYSFSLPIYSNTAYDQYIPNAALILDSSVPTEYNAKVSIGANYNQITLGILGSGVRAGYPMTFATGDTITIECTYSTK